MPVGVADYSLSHDGGTTLGPATADPALKDSCAGAGCQGSMLGVGGSVYFSHPDSAGPRVNMTVMRSTDNAASWSSSFAVSPPVRTQHRPPARRPCPDLTRHAHAGGQCATYEQCGVDYSSLVPPSAADPHHLGILWEEGCLAAGAIEPACPPHLAQARRGGAGRARGLVAFLWYSKVPLSF